MTKISNTEAYHEQRLMKITVVWLSQFRIKEKHVETRTMTQFAQTKEFAEALFLI